MLPDSNFKPWLGKGIIYLEDIMDGSGIKDFKILQTEYIFPPQDQYKYSQIAHLLKKNSQLCTTLPEKITQYYQQTPPGSKGISIIYSGLQEKNICTKSQSMIAWEQELGSSY